MMTEGNRCLLSKMKADWQLDSQKGGRNTLYKEIERQYKNLNQKIQAVKFKLQSYPEGELFCTRNEKRFKWYCKKNHEKVYIPKCSQAFAEQLARKKYYTLLLSYLEQEKLALEAYLKKNSQNYLQKLESFLSNPGYQKLLSKSFSPKSQELTEWENAEYRRSEKYPEQLLHKTSAGIYVRSKSEAMIALFLQTNQIPFRYEDELQLGSVLIYPDFTIRHPSTGEYFYWEHFGLMDDLAYSQNAYSKMQLYTSNGIIPSLNLITTFETQKHPLTTEMIENVIQQYFA